MSREQERAITHFPWARAASIMTPFGAGAILGVTGPLADKSDHPIAHAVAIVFSGGWSWACFAFLVGYSRRSKTGSAILAASALTVGVALYYLLKYLSPAAGGGQVLSGGPIEETASKIILWSVAAFLLGGPVGLMGNLARTPGFAGLPFRMVIPAIAIFETTMRLRAEADLQVPLVGLTWSVIRFLSVVAVVALIGHTVWRWRVRRGRPYQHAEANALLQDVDALQHSTRDARG
ncbi:hypothetical protein [Streptomyces sp. UH6]|uniref:hypothetical protein n=1 Tax=Streptomyces sp. UH6 TaxID=2748379 RepID=UPI0015D4E9A5|nr:hypothetical protein [Streptomyces sp. UH6]NYV74531.1 hypothetical protein [Streptomyces sp. UH6]